MSDKIRIIAVTLFLIQLSCGATSKNSIKEYNNINGSENKNISSEVEAKNYFKQGWYYEQKKNYYAALQMYIKADEMGHSDAEERLKICKKVASKNYDNDIAAAEYFYKKRKYARARQMCLYIELYNKDDSRNSKLKKKIEKKLISWTKPYKDKAQYYYNKNDYKKAKFMTFRLLRVDPYDEEAKRFIMHCDKMIEYNETYKYALALYNRGRYNRAYKNFKYIDERIKDFRDTTKLMNECQKILKKRGN